MALKASLGATVEYLLNKQQQKQVKKEGRKKRFLKKKLQSLLDSQNQLLQLVKHLNVVHGLLRLKKDNFDGLKKTQKV